MIRVNVAEKRLLHFLQKITSSVLPQLALWTATTCQYYAKSDIEACRRYSREEN